jgi:hypothetical protein
MIKKRKLPSKNAGRKIGSYSLVNKFTGYNARTDPTNIGNTYLVTPSQNVVMNTSGRAGIVKGYVLDGATSSVIDSGILSNYDFTNFKGDIRNMRAGFLTSALNDGRLQYRYITNGSTVNWVDLKTGLTNVVLSFCDFYDYPATPSIKLMLWVDQSANIFSWNGAITTLASATATTVTKQGTTNWTNEGFFSSGTRSIVINGVTATYTGGEGTTTLTGVSVDFSATTVGTIIHQLPVTTTLASMTNMLSTLVPTVIGLGRNNQIYVGSSSNNAVYISKSGNFKDYSFSSPRLAGEGSIQILESPPVKFIAQEVRDATTDTDMWISHGTNSWSVVRFILQVTYASTGVPSSTVEIIQLLKLKTAPLQGAMSERLAAKMKNHIVFIGNDKVANFLGHMSYQFVPVMQDFSYPIIDDMNSYDMTNASIFYHKNYIYVSIPKSGIIRIYNMTDQTQEQYSARQPEEQINNQQPWFWEAPVLYPISGFYVVNGEIYGHGFNTSESYKLFTSGSFNCQQIEAIAAFGYDDKGDRTTTKLSDECWVEGYIKQNTNLSCTIVGDLGSFQSTQTNIINGNDSGIVSYGTGGHALGKNNLGTSPLGGAFLIASTLPAWFHVVLTYGPTPFYLEQIQFYTKGVDLDWQLICYGTNALPTAEGNNDLNR